MFINSDFWSKYCFVKNINDKFISEQSYEYCVHNLRYKFHLKFRRTYFGATPLTGSTLFYVSPKAFHVRGLSN